MKKLFILFIVLINFISTDCRAISAKSAVLIDSASGRVLYEHNAYEKLPMASTTKIMTGLLACESGKLNKTVKASAVASGTEGSSLWLKIGEKQTLENLTYGLMLKSGNDAAVAIAEFLGGNIDSFAILMTEKARKIGAVNTNFKNPHGLDADGHYTTAYDLALIAREAMKNEKFRKIVSTQNYSIPMEGETWDRALKNHNKMLWMYDGCNGIKTGYTKKCGRCLVTSAQRDGIELICVTLNASDDWNDHKYLLDYGFSSHTAKKVINKGEKLAKLVYDKKNNKSVMLAAKDSFSVTVKEGDVLELKTNLTGVSAPAKKGTVCGTAEIFCNGEKIGSVELVTEKSIKKTGFFEKFIMKLKKLF